MIDNDGMCTNIRICHSTGLAMRISFGWAAIRTPGSEVFGEPEVSSKIELTFDDYKRRVSIRGKPYYVAGVFGDYVFRIETTAGAVPPPDQSCDELHALF